MKSALISRLSHKEFHILITMYLYSYLCSASVDRPGTENPSPPFPVPFPTTSLSLSLRPSLKPKHSLQIHHVLWFNLIISCLTFTLLFIICNTSETNLSLTDDKLYFLFFSVDGHAWCSLYPLWYVCTNDYSINCQFFRFYLFVVRAKLEDDRGGVDAVCTPLRTHLIRSWYLSLSLSDSCSISPPK